MKKFRKQCKRSAKKVSTKKVVRTLHNARDIAVAAQLAKVAIVAVKVAV
jgi:hypothetical protein